MTIGEYIHHYHVLRVGALGEGILRPTFYSLPDKDGNQDDYVLPTVNMTTLGKNPSNTLANVKEYAVQLELKTTAIDEYFVINRILVYTLPVDTGLPG